MSTLGKLLVYGCVGCPFLGRRRSRSIQEVVCSLADGQTLTTACADRVPAWCPLRDVPHEVVVVLAPEHRGDGGTDRGTSMNEPGES